MNPIEYLKSIGIELIGRYKSVLYVNNILYFCSHLGTSYIEFKDGFVCNKVEDNLQEDHIMWKGMKFHDFRMGIQYSFDT